MSDHHDPFTMEARLCDDAGMVSDELVTPPRQLAQDLTYLGLLNNLRARNTFGNRTPITQAFTCTGSAHLAGEHIRCTSPAHDRVQPIPGGNAITPVIGQPLNGWQASTSGFDPADHPEAFPAIAQQRGTAPGQGRSSSPASNAHNGGMLVPHATEMETVSGRLVDLLKPDPATIDLGDIAHHLGMLCRYNGGIRRFYSVAEHVLLVRDLMRSTGDTDELLRAALLHDAAEAYLGDVISPEKYALRYLEHNESIAMCDLDGFRGAFTKLTERLDRAIGEHFDIDPALFDHPDVKLADMWALRIEAAELTHSRGCNWRWPRELPNGGKLPAGVVWKGGLQPDVAAMRLDAALAAAITTDVVVIPDDGKEHDCACGHPGYRACDRDGWLPPVVADNEGRPCQWCHTCDRELEPGKPAGSSRTGRSDRIATLLR